MAAHKAGGPPPRLSLCVAFIKPENHDNSVCRMEMNTKCIKQTLCVYQSRRALAEIRPATRCRAYDEKLNIKIFLRRTKKNWCMCTSGVAWIKWSK